MLKNKCTRGRARGFAGLRMNFEADKKEPTASGGCGTVSNIEAAGSSESIANSSGNTLTSNNGELESKDDDKEEADTPSSSGCASDSAGPEMVLHVSVIKNGDLDCKDDEKDEADTPSPAGCASDSAGAEIDLHLSVIKNGVLENKDDEKDKASTPSPAGCTSDSEQAETDLDMSIIRSLEDEFALCAIEGEPPDEDFGEIEAEEPNVLMVAHQDSKEEELVSKESGAREASDLSETHAVVSNYVMLKKLPEFGIFVYEVEFDRDTDLRTKKSLLRRQEGIGIHLFDGTMLYTVGAVPEYCHLLESLDESLNHVCMIQLFQCTEVEVTGRIKSSLYKSLLSSIMKKLGLQQMGRNYYDPSKVINLDEENLDLWPGFIASIREHEAGILLGVDVTHKILQRKTALDVINQVTQRCNDRKGEQFKKMDVLKALKGQLVVTQYNPQQYRIDDVDFEASPRKEFVKRDGGATTIEEYLGLKWGIRLSDDELDQPLLVSHNNGELVLLVPSLCIMTGLTDGMRKKMNIMKGLCTCIHMAPEERRMVLSEFIQKLSVPEIQEELQKWHLELDETFLPVPCRNLTKEKIQLCTVDGRLAAKKEWFIPDDKNDWSEHFRNAGLVEPMSLQKWLLFVPDEMEEADCTDFINKMQKTARKLGCKLAAPVRTFWYKSNTRFDVSEFTKTFRENRNGVQLIFYILPKDSGRYAEVKRICTLRCSVASQCLHIRNTGNRLYTSICQKLVIQMCAKLRGQPWTVGIPLSKPMVLGFTTSYCAKTSRYIGSLVASTNSNCTKYFSTISYYKDRSRASGGIKTGVWKSLEAYVEKNGKELPGQIILYRDGVSEDELDRIAQSELQQLETGIQTFCKRMGCENNAKVVFIVVTHSQGMRLFLGDSGKWKNLKPGSAISTNITYPDRNHFTMVSSHARRGSANPTDYNVLHNTMDEFTQENIQDLTYKLCHLYFNSTCSVGVPAPCRYAQKLAQMTSTAIEQEVSMSLAHSLWFL